jgi:DNA-binding beta-propeller fold protein YncE
MAPFFHSCLLVLALSAPAAFAQTLATLAGNGTEGFSGDGAAATAASLAFPQGVASDAVGNVYIADTLNNRIRKVDVFGNITTFAGTGTLGFSGDGGPATAAQLYGPVGLAVDTAGNVYVADTQNHRVRRISGGIITTIAGTGAPGYTGDNGDGTAAKLSSPFGVAWAGDLYIADTGNHVIRRLAVSGTITTVAGTGVPGFAGEGAHPLSANLFVPAAVASGGGFIYVSDYVNRRVRRFTVGGTIDTVAGNGTAGFSGDGGAGPAAALNNPFGVAVDAAGNIYIADSGNHRIRMLTPALVISTFAGTGSAAFAGDGGPPAGASFSSPAALAVDVLGDLLIADTSNHRVRKVVYPKSPYDLVVTRSGIGSGSVSSTAGIDCGSDCSEPLAPLTGVTLTATPSGAAYTFAGWTGVTCAEGAASPVCSFTLTGNVTANAAFDAPTYTVTAAATGAAEGSVAMSHGSCVGGCLATVGLGTSVTLTAMAGGVSRFAGWEGVTCNQGAMSEVCTVVVTADIAAVARFGYNVSVTKTGAGTGTITSDPAGLSCGPACTFAEFVYMPGTTVILTAAAEPGSAFTGWNGGGCSGTGSCVLTVTGSTGAGATFIVPNPPSAPQRASTTSGNGIATLRFDAPASVGGGAITQYDALCMPGPFAATGAASPLVVNGLTNGTTYACTVTASNVDGPGPSTAAMKVTPLATRTGPMAYVSGQGVAVIDRASYQVSSTIAIPTRNAVVDPSASRIYLTDDTSYTLYAIDASTHAVVDSLPMATGSTSIALSPSGDRAYVATGAAELKVVDTASLTVVSTIPVAGAGRVAVRPDGARIYVTAGSNLAVIDAATEAVSLVPLGFTTSVGVAVNPAGTRVYVTGTTPSVAAGTVVIDAASSSVVATIPLSFIAGGVAVDPTGAYTYVVQTATGALMVKIDNATHTVVDTEDFTLGQTCDTYGYCPVSAVAVYPDGSRIIGAHFGLNGARSVRVMDAATLDVLASIGPDLSAFSLAIAPTLPGAPSIGTGAPGNGSATIAFSAPALNGGSRITGYTVTCNGTFTASGPSSPIVVTGLTNGVAYDCSVTATNAVGTGPASGSVSVTPAVPSAVLTVTKAGAGSGSVTSTPAGIDCGATCSQAFVLGTPLALVATPAAGSVFAGWTGACTGAAGCALVMDAAKDVTATFNISTFTVTPSAGANGSISPATPQTVNQGATASFTVTPNAGYTASVGGTCGGNLAGNTYTTNPVFGNCTVEASFTPRSYTVAVSSNGPLGTVATSFSACAGGCQALLTHGTIVTLTALAGSGSFASWSGVACAEGSVSTTCTVTVTSDISAVANFGHDVSVTKTGAGTGTVTSSPPGISCGPACTYAQFVYMAGTSVTLTAAAQPGSTFAGWSSGSCSGTAPCVVTANAQTGVLATFTTVPTVHTVTPSAGANGSISPNTPQAVSHGATTSFTITPAAGFEIDSVVGCGGSLAGNVFTTGAITADCTVTASFKAADPPRLGNISTRMQVLTGNDVMIGGFVIGGSGNKTVAIVATGPSLVPFGITNALANPTLRLVRSSDQATLATNDDWASAANAAQLTAAGFAPANTLESAILINLPPGAYTAIVEGVGGGTGVAVIGVYEVDGLAIPLTNISTRGRVLTGNDVMIGGFVIQGSGAQTVAIVATGPSLIPFGIAHALANPTIRLVRSSDQVVIDGNDDWASHANAAQLTAAGFAPSNALESGIHTTLPPGAYTVIVEGVGGGTGVAVVGVYKVQ